ncbi:MAG: folK [Massilibacillus sp.]|jgi:2-amino-4-hydroxy-6-hydroxymethyldihydropteridine diphosphokinase|nr:folK [Massilibacillus sp.]
MILLGLGSNKGDRKQNILAAIDKMNANTQITVEKISSIYETEPYGLKNQASYLNGVVEISTNLLPEELLDACLLIEKELGRTRDVHWGPRTIDIDLLIYHDATLSLPKLTLPHPYLALRRFVLVPILNITNAVIMNGCNVQQLLEVCPDDGKVEIYEENIFEE